MMTQRNEQRERPVRVRSTGALLDGNLTVPLGANGIVLFAHGSGSSRHSPRNRKVADALSRAGLATLLFDLLTSEEEAEDAVTRRLRFDIDLLATRLVGGIEWVLSQPETGSMRVGLFGASTGAAAALIAAAEMPQTVSAVVSRGGRPDLAGDYLKRVRAPTLLIVGGEDDIVLRLNEQARQKMWGVDELAVVPGATHLFEEPGTMDEVISLAAGWFVRYLARRTLEARI
jgi:putative phosphoribosyl transferase